MKMVHLSDLHLGKRVLEFSMIEDQKYILEQILRIVDEVKPDAVLIAGDVYDKSVPSAEAVELLDEFLCRLAERKLQVFLISGNHDSAERLAFGGRLLDASGVHLSPVYNGEVESICLQDEFGPVYFYMLPFIKPAHVRRFFPDETIESYTDAVSVALKQMNIDQNSRNVLLTHQFVTGASRCESEEISVGGSDNVDASVFEGFEYVALGHIHGAQNIEAGNVRYCGTPLKYSFSEVSHKKSVSVVELGEKGMCTITEHELMPMRDMQVLKGAFAELIKADGAKTENYTHAILNDEDDVPEAAARLRMVYPNLMKLTYDNTRTRRNGEIETDDDISSKSPMDLFAELYEMQNNQPMSEQQEAFVRQVIERIWEDGQ